MHIKKINGLSIFLPHYIELNSAIFYSDAPRAQRGASRSLNLIIYELCR
jgi:hypothetical protein